MVELAEKATDCKLSSTERDEYDGDPETNDPVAGLQVECRFRSSQREPSRS